MRWVDMPTRAVADISLDAKHHQQRYNSIGRYAKSNKSKSQPITVCIGVGYGGRTTCPWQVLMRIMMMMRTDDVPARTQHCSAPEYGSMQGRDHKERR